MRAIEAKTNVSGLSVQRVEVSDANAFGTGKTMESLTDEMLSRLIESFRPIDEKDRAGLIELLQRQADETQEYISTIKARPITAERCDLAKLPTQWQDLRPHSPRRITNGNGSRNIT